MYRAAKQVGVQVRHRFVAKGSAVMLIGPEGDRAVLDMVDGSIIEDGGPTEARWSTFLAVFSDKAGNLPRIVAEDIVREVVSRAPSGETDDQPTAPPEIS